MITHLKEDFRTFFGYFLFWLSFFVYHLLPIVSTTAILVLMFMGGLSWLIVSWYLGVVGLCCLLLAISTISGR